MSACGEDYGCVGEEGKRLPAACSVMGGESLACRWCNVESKAVIPPACREADGKVNADQKKTGQDKNANTKEMRP